MIIKDLQTGIETTCDNFGSEPRDDRLVIFLCEGDCTRYWIDFHAIDCAVLATILVEYWAAREQAGC